MGKENIAHQMSFLKQRSHNLDRIPVFALPERVEQSITVQSDTSSVLTAKVVQQENWRNDPATSRQLSNICRACIILGITEPVEENTITKGEASDLQGELWRRIRTNRYINRKRKS